MAPADVCRRAACEWDRTRECYRLAAWNSVYEVFPAAEAIRSTDVSRPPVDIETGLSIVFYLLRARDAPLSGEWVSEKDLAGGVAFFRGPHALPVQLIREHYGNDLEGFGRACRSLGGERIAMADAAFSFRVLPRVPAAVLYWRPDDEFDARVRLLFDRTIGLHLPIDVIFGVGVEICSRLAAADTA